MKNIAIVGLLLASITATGAQAAIPRGSSLFIEEMDGDLDGFLRAELIKQRVPLQIVLDRDLADYVMTGAGQSDPKTNWHEGFLTSSKDHATGNVLIMAKGSKVVTWASQAGDKGFWTNNGGHRRVAERLIKDLKKSVAK